MQYKNFDFKKPDYVAVFEQRLAFLKEIRANPECIPSLKAYYKNNPAEFISDFGVTFDPRNAERGLPTVIPFVLFEKQREFVDWVIDRWKHQSPGLCEKSRDIGISWLAPVTACTLCLHHDGLAVGFGSRLNDYVDKIGTMKPLLPKARMFMEYLPEEFRGGYQPWRDAPFMRLNFPETGSIIMGEGGDQIGRGDRASIYFVDESAYLERPELVEHSLSQTTNCRIDMSSVNGMNNPFAKKRHSGKIDVFIFDWRDDPRKDAFWYESLSLGTDQFIERPDGTKIYGKGLSDVTIAQEVDRDYSASVTGIVIPGAWVRSAIDAAEVLGIVPSGKRGLTYDPADEGDKNAAAGRYGFEVDFLDQWSGKGSDTFASVQRVFEICDDNDYSGFRYDSDGLGALVRGDARVINEARRLSNQRQVAIQPFRGSEGVFNPEGLVEGTMGSDGEKGRTNQDYFANRKAQGWWSLRRRFERTHRWVTAVLAARKNGTAVDPAKICKPDEIISINSKIPLCMQLVAELSQPTYSQNGVGKMVINKKPDSMPSPNLADGVMMEFAEIEPPTMKITTDMIAAIVRAGSMGPRRRR